MQVNQSSVEFARAAQEVARLSRVGHDKASCITLAAGALTSEGWGHLYAIEVATAAADDVLAGDHA